MKAKELRQKTVAEMEKEFEDLQKNLQALRFDLSGGKLKNVRLIRKARKDLARLKTIIKEKGK